MYYVYVVVCADETYYTGIAKDLSKRILEHNQSTRGARYTKSRRPVELVYSEQAPNRSDAQKREYQIRSLSHSAKAALRTKTSDPAHEGVCR